MSITAKLLQSTVCRTNAVHRPVPSLFFFPGLNTQPVWPNSKFPFVELLRSNYHHILEEYNQLSKQNGSDYLIDDQKLHNGKWDWHSYVSKGKRNAHFAATCPKTTEILESLTEIKTGKLMTNTPFSFAFFSTMHPQSEIAAHHAPCNLRLRCHFPLIVPKEESGDFGIRIADEIVKWKENEPFLFDDAYSHEGKYFSTHN